MIITRAMPTQQTAITGVSRRITAGQEIKAELCRGPGFQATFNELAIASVVLPDPANTTLAVGLNSLVSNPLIQQGGLMAAGGLIMAIPLVIVFLDFRSYEATR